MRVIVLQDTAWNDVKGVFSSVQQILDKYPGYVRKDDYLEHTTKDTTKYPVYQMTWHDLELPEL